MKQSFVFYQILLAFFLLTACKGKGIGSLQKATGAPYEVLLVAKQSVLDSEEGKQLKQILSSDIPGLPQPESQFRVSTCATAHFDNILKPVRNIMIVEISDIYSQPKFSFARDEWAEGQMILYLRAPSLQSLKSFIPANKQVIIDFFVNSEMNRTVAVLRDSYNRESSDKLLKHLGVEMNIPYELNQTNMGENFFWASNNGRTGRIDMVVYSVPYTDKNAFTLPKIIARRDSIMKKNIPGAYPDSYMATSTFVDPVYRALSLDGKYVGETRGLWEVKGDVMGGPFVSHTRLDEANQRIITAEVFVYAPESKKRNLVRKAEAALYTLKLPQDNLLPEVPVLITQ